MGALTIDVTVRRNKNQPAQLLGPHALKRKEKEKKLCRKLSAGRQPVGRLAGHLPWSDTEKKEETNE